MRQISYEITVIIVTSLSVNMCLWFCSVVAFMVVSIVISMFVVNLLKRSRIELHILSRLCARLSLGLCLRQSGDKTVMVL
jgi:hypothetical protein